MKYFRQFGLIMLVTVVGELIKHFVPLPIPASVYGLCIMLFCLITGIIKLKAVENAAVFLVEIMPIMFMPAGVGLLTSMDELKNMLLPLLIIIPVSTVFVMVVSGVVAQKIIEKGKK